MAEAESRLSGDETADEEETSGRSLLHGREEGVRDVNRIDWKVRTELQIFSVPIVFAA